MTYGMKAYGKTHVFKSKSEYKKFLLEWMRGTEGSERDRAVDALMDLEAGKKFTDTDAN